MPEPIDFNGELATVGLSNIIVGLTGSGYTGESDTICQPCAPTCEGGHPSVPCGCPPVAPAEAVVTYMPSE